MSSTYSAGPKSTLIQEIGWLDKKERTKNAYYQWISYSNTVKKKVTKELVKSEKDIYETTFPSLIY